MRRHLIWFGLIFLAAGAVVEGQNVAVTPATLELQAIEGWTVGAKMLTVQATGGWWVKSSGVDWLAIAPGSGTGQGTAKVSIREGALALAAGDYTAQITYGINGTTTPSGSIAVTLKIAKSQFSRPVYSYLNTAPVGCKQATPYEDPATCDVPGEKPPGNFAPPVRGGNYLDPNFGALVRIVTDPQSWHSYSTPSALNAGNQYMLYSQSDNWIIQETFSGRTVRGSSPVGEGSMWDATNPNWIYSLRGARVERYDVKENKTTVVVDYSKTTPKFGSINNGGAGDTSKDNWISFYAPTEKQICALDLIAVKTYCASYENRGPVTLDPSGRGTLISKGADSQTGKRYIMLIAQPTMAVFSVNVAAARLDFEYLAPERVDGTGNGNGICEPGESCYKGEHSDTFEDAQGVQYLVGEMEVSAPCSFGINSFRLSRPNLLAPEEVGGGGHRLVILQACGGVDPWVDWHLSCAKQSHYCAVSTTYGGFEAARQPADKTPVKRTAHLSELFVIGNHGAEVRRLVQHRSIPFKNEDTNGYWSTPRASISYDGSYVVFTSNFGEPNRQRVAVVETGFGRTVIAGVFDAAGLSKALAPGGLSTVMGENLASCNRGLETIEAESITTTLCNAVVRVGGVPAPMVYASTAQINFVIPSGIIPGKDTPLTVERGPDPADQAAWMAQAQDLKRAAPAIFGYSLEDGLTRAVVQTYDVHTGQVTLNGPGEFSTTQQAPGQVGVIYATNLGPVDPSSGDVIPAPDPLHRTVLPVDVVVNDVLQSVLFSGLTPGFIGLYQINYALKSGTPLLPPGQNRIWVLEDGEESPHLDISLKAP